MKGTPSLRSLSIATPCAALFLIGAFHNAQATGDPADFEKQVKPVLKTYCGPCHAGKNPPGGINPTQYRTMAEVQKASPEFDRILRALKAGTMPPPNAKQPTANERKALISDIESILAGDCKLADPGRVTIRRLNRTEYTNTIRDLVGVDFKRTDDFPSDDVGYGFDNIGDVLTVSPLLLEKYLFAAEQIAEEAIVTGVAKPKRYEGNELLAGEGRSTDDRGDSVLFTAATVYVEHAFPAGGDYRVKVQAYGIQAGPEPCKMSIGVDGVAQAPMDVPQKAGKPGIFEVPINVKAGKHRVEVKFLNDYYNPADPNPANRDRNMVVSSIEISAPSGGRLDYAQLPPSHLRIIPSAPVAGKELESAKQVLTNFASRAFRRPATSEEIERVMTVFKSGNTNKESYERSIQLGVTAILTSPNFLFRVEPQAKPGAELSSWQIASRLSYFLWASMPDKTLFELAAQDKLRDKQVLTQQVDRMLADPKADTLTTNFAAQWLQVPKFMNSNPDRKKYPTWTPQIKGAMRQEALSTFRYVFFGDRPITEFLVGQYAVVNDALATYYGIPGVTGKEFRRVDVDPNVRGGVLGMGSVLTLTSNPNRTSPTKRGRWILEQILGTPPPPPPPGADQLAASPQGAMPKSIREQLQVHRKNPDCASCHALLDPLGFALENFDGVGLYRTEENATPIDSSGELIDGTKFQGLGELKKALVGRKDQFTHAFAEKLLTYALGRGMRLADNCAVDDVAEAAAKNGYRPKAMIHAIVQTDAFRKQGS